MILSLFSVSSVRHWPYSLTVWIISSLCFASCDDDDEFELLLFDELPEEDDELSLFFLVLAPLFLLLCYCLDLGAM